MRRRVCHDPRVDYDDIASAYLDVPAPDVPVGQLTDTPARRLRDAVEPLATQGWWARAVHEHPALAEVGFLEAYVWGRAASLGNPEASVVVAAFAFFEPGHLAGVYEDARRRVGRAEVLAAREEGATRALADVLSGAEVSALADRLFEAMDGLDAAGRPLFAGLRQLPVPADPFGRLWRATEMVREHRGDGHVAASVAAGMDPVSMNVLTELWVGYPVGEYTATRGYGEEALAASLDALGRRGWVAHGRLTEAGRAARTDIEAATDRSQETLIGRLGDRADAVIADLAALSARVIAGRGVPADPRKRDAG